MKLVITCVAAGVLIYGLLELAHSLGKLAGSRLGYSEGFNEAREIYKIPREMDSITVLRPCGKDCFTGTDLPVKSEIWLQSKDRGTYIFKVKNNE